MGFAFKIHAMGEATTIEIKEASFPFLRKFMYDLLLRCNATTQPNPQLGIVVITYRNYVNVKLINVTPRHLPNLLNLLIAEKITIHLENNVPGLLGSFGDSHITAVSSSQDINQFDLNAGFHN